MFFGPRRPMDPYSPVSRRPLGRAQQPPQRPRGGLLSLLQDQEGNYDFEKITATARQLNGIYSQVSPMISKFMKK
ncbi:YppG family protein [Bacillus sp. PK3_68]|uniref:YppG family protein n=1 Tax=Bacillus sp. PK3_68 TaxID=2027408 RepID=UPI0016018618|nr:YppG family protein [Bacillus sp. PK3_68]